VGAQDVDTGGACGDANNSSCKVLFLSHFDLSLNGLTVFLKILHKFQEYCLGVWATGIWTDRWQLS